ncbi:MAG: hypothetical protein OXH94_05230 [Rhodospirillales bacterium]|nr:hypothetical protein [Rhodospirillales bacterium]
MPPIMAAMLAAAMTVPAAAAGDEPELVTALRAKGAQIVALGKRGGLAGYLVTPEGGAGYSLYVTGDGHGVAGLLYGRATRRHARFADDGGVWPFGGRVERRRARQAGQ